MKAVRKIILSGMMALAGVAGLSACATSGLPKAVSNETPLGSGPFPVTPSTDARLPDHTIYDPLRGRTQPKQKLPIVVWGVGGCLDKGTWFRWFLSEIASHGYLVVSNGKIGALADQSWRPEPAPNQGPPDPAAAPPAPTSARQLIAAIDWAIAENSRAGSPYQGRIDTANIAVMGMSCGGVQAIEAGADRRVTTTVVWNMGLFPDESGLNATAGGKALVKADLAKLHGAVAYISGDEMDVAFPNANDDFAHLPNIPALRAYRKQTPHEGTYWEKNGGEFGKVAVGWLDWRLKGDPQARAMFVGTDCGLCRNPRWVVRQKNLK
ncbi:dienelactone hydrolase [Sphingobium sp. B11D3B]|uniref:hypothetical protein n=1 Tax=Sphingobium sp. B11D3B TaxID=2940575 RepID=UPI00222632B6|nr:hypothetical protein [Sphingobium sp. B11D3B]MCW2390080.1 dienelactone hydrolase [Sphingobium sp. B11D3B]